MEVKADVLSDVLRAVRLTGAVYFDLDLGAPWVADTPPAREIAGMVMPGAQRVVPYHVLARGSGWSSKKHRAENRRRLVSCFRRKCNHSGAAMSSAPSCEVDSAVTFCVRPTSSVDLAVLTVMTSCCARCEGRWPSIDAMTPTAKIVIRKIRMRAAIAFPR